MKKHSALLLLPVLLLVAATGCRRNNDPLPPPTPEAPAELVRRVEWSNGLVSWYNYHPDSTLSHINFGLGTVQGSVRYFWVGKKLEEMFVEGSIYTNKYYYANGKLSKITASHQYPDYKDTYRLDFEYNTTGTLTKLKHFDVNEAGSVLQNDNTYFYKANGELEKIVVISGSSIITDTFEAYSAPIRIPALVFVGASLTEHYHWQNLPILEKMKKIPARITRSISTNGGPSWIEKITENDCSISNKRLDSMTTTITYPSHPNYNTSLTYKFFY